MLWQLLVPGTQTVTVTVGMLITFEVPVPTVIAAVFAALAAIGWAVGLAGKPLLPDDESELPPPPPPHAATSETSATVATTRAHLLSFTANCMARLPSVVTVTGYRNR
jgi:hypothetical protein